VEVAALLICIREGLIFGRGGWLSWLEVFFQFPSFEDTEIIAQSSELEPFHL
jgi:hypothetical protein